MAGRVPIRHLCFFEALAVGDERSSEWNASRAGLLLLRELDDLFEHGASSRSDSARRLREALLALDPRSPMRAALEGVLPHLERRTPRKPRPLLASLVSFGDAARRVLGVRAAADVYDSVRQYASPSDADIAREAARRLRHLQPG